MAYRVCIRGAKTKTLRIGALFGGFGYLTPLKQRKNNEVGNCLSYIFGKLRLRSLFHFFHQLEKGAMREKKRTTTYDLLYI